MELYFINEACILAEMYVAPLATMGSSAIQGAGVLSGINEVDVV